MFTSRCAGILGVLVAGVSFWTAEVRAARPNQEEMAQRDQWVKEHFPQRAAAVLPVPAAAKAAEPALMVWANYGPVMCNSIEGRPLQIAEHKFENGIYRHAPSRVQVYLPSPAKSFSAVVGILHNPKSVGGSVVFSVRVGEKQIYASPIKHRGEAGTPVTVDLAGAGDFYLSVSSTGDGISSDQAVWGNAKVTLVDGREMRVGDLPVQDAMTRKRGAATPPFSFFYNRRPSDEFLPTWKFQEEQLPVVAGKTTHGRTYTDPQTGLQVRCTLTECADFPTVEWMLSLKNTGDRDTPMIEGLLPLDTRLQCSQGGEFLLHHFTGSPCTPADYEPFETTLAPKSSKRINTEGGRPTNSSLPYFNIETGGGGVIAVISWAGQWAAQFSRDDGRELRIASGQESTAFRLHPGEEVRSPLIVLQFYRGDWIRAQNVWRSWMMAHNVPRRDGKPLPPFLFVCNGNYYESLMTTAAGEMQFLRRYIEEGIQADYWDQDAGWYPCDGVGWPKVGTWEVDKNRWPKGIREVSDFLRAHGTKTITWFEPERV